MKTHTGYRTHRQEKLGPIIKGFRPSYNPTKKNTVYDLLKRKQEREMGMSFWQKIWRKIKYLWFTAGIKASRQTKKLFKTNKLSNA